MNYIHKKSFFKKNSLALVLSFLLPVGIMAVSYFQLGIYPTSDRTILASDGFGQLVNFYSGFNNLLHGQQSIFYTWSGSLGLNFISLMSYYVNSLFSFLVFFFDNGQMPDGMYLIFLTKIGAMGVTFWVFSHNTFRLPQEIKVILSVSYALMSFTVAYSIMLMWLDAMVYLPLVLLGIHRIMDKQKPVLLFGTYFLLFITNYYMAFMVGLFSFLYFFVRTFTEWSRYKKSVLQYIITSFLAGGASMIVILPSIIDLRTNGEKTDAIKSFFTKDTGPWDIIIKSMVGVYDTSKFGSSPFIYIGLVPLLFCLFYFVTNKIPLKNKLLYGGLLAVMVMSVYVEPLNLFWQGMHSPNMFLFRYSFLYSVLVLIIAGFGLEKFGKNDMNILGNIIVNMIALFVLTVILANKKRYGYITQASLVGTVGLLVIYLVLFSLKKKEKLPRRLVPILLVSCVGGELFFNTYQIIAGIDQEWGYVSRQKYIAAYQDIEPLVKKTQGQNETFYRLENLDPASQTDSFNYNYSGVTMFSSIRNRHSSQYLDQLGFRSDGTNLTIQYKNNTILMDDLLGVKYNLAKGNLNKYGFEAIDKHGEYILYENKNALPLGMLTDKGIYEKKNNSNQAALIQYLSQIDEPFFNFTGLSEVSRTNMYIREVGDFTVFSEENNLGEDKNITWEVNVPAKSQAYLNLNGKTFRGKDPGKVEITVNGVTSKSEIKSSGSFHNLGFYEKATTLKVMAKFSGTAMVTLVRPSVFTLKIDTLDRAIEVIKAKEIIFDVQGNHVQAKVFTESDQVIFTTIPYDPGWTAKIDGKAVEIKAVHDALISIEVPKGKHQIQLTYYPKGIKLGGLLFVSTVFIFCGYVYWCCQKRRSS